MNAMKRFLLAVRGIRAPHVQDDDDNTYRPYWWGSDEDPSFDFIRREAAARAHSDLMESIARGQARPQKKLTIITTADVDLKKTGQK